MARQIGKLSAVAVRSMKTPGLFADGGNLYLQITPECAKTWIFRFQLNGKRRDMGLGPLHTISLAEAREEARRLRQSVRDGIDPIEARKAAKAAARAEATPVMTFKLCAEAYIRAHEAEWKNEKHAAQWSSTLETYAYPVLGHLAVSAVNKDAVMQVLEPIWTTKTETASRLRGRMEVILDWASVHQYRTEENPARWRGHLEHLLPARAKVQKSTHHAALPYDKIRTFMADLDKQEGIGARALEFAILTATRTGEVLGAKWSEIDMMKKVWTIPADRMKAGKEHRVPLSQSAMAIAARMQSIKMGDYLFPGGKSNSPLSNMALLTVLRRMRRTDLTVHGFRSTFRDWCAEKTSYPSEVAEMALAHTVGSKVEAAYRRGDLFQKRVDLMGEWDRQCFDEPKVSFDPRRWAR